MGASVVSTTWKAISRTAGYDGETKTRKEYNAKNIFHLKPETKLNIFGWFRNSCERLPIGMQEWGNLLGNFEGRCINVLTGQ